jgi:hypothetical protein
MPKFDGYIQVAVGDHYIRFHVNEDGSPSWTSDEDLEAFTSGSHPYLHAAIDYFDAFVESVQRAAEVAIDELELPKRRG